jgi:lipopolysaccharide/colanic/teichoic acid biosynthesis glycosyltransferase
MGLDYIVSDQKADLDASVARYVQPLARAAAMATELAIFGCVSEDNLFIQTREGVNGTQIELPKIRTMRAVEQDAEMDIDRYSSRIVNKRALLARVVGLDELPQWDLIASGELSMVGPRPLLRASRDKFSMLVEEAGVASEKVDEWRDFLNVAKPGLFGKSNAMKHRRNFDEYTPKASARIIDADLQYKRRASIGVDVKTVLFSVGTTLIEGVRSLK